MRCGLPASCSCGWGTDGGGRSPEARPGDHRGGHGPGHPQVALALITLGAVQLEQGEPAADASIDHGLAIKLSISKMLYLVLSTRPLFDSTYVHHCYLRRQKLQRSSLPADPSTAWPFSKLMLVFATVEFWPAIVDTHIGRIGRTFSVVDPCRAQTSGITNPAGTTGVRTASLVTCWSGRRSHPVGADDRIVLGVTVRVPDRPA
jgi:hypothetical protein